MSMYMTLVHVCNMWLWSSCSAQVLHYSCEQNVRGSCAHRIEILVDVKALWGQKPCASQEQGTHLFLLSLTCPHRAVALILGHVSSKGMSPSRRQERAPEFEYLEIRESMALSPEHGLGLRAPRPSALSKWPFASLSTMTIESNEDGDNGTDIFLPEQRGNLLKRHFTNMIYFSH